LPRQYPGRFVAFEGIEGSGKSSQQRLAAEALGKREIALQVTAEPGGTGLGVHLRRLVLHSEDTVPTPRAELFLYLADRAQHVEQVILPELEAGRVVLCDRFTASTLAYQGYGRGLDLDAVERAESWARGGLTPDLTLLLDCPVSVGLERASGPDRFHAETVAFHERVRAGFLALAENQRDTWRVIDSTRPQAEVHEAVMRAIEGCLTGRASA